MNQPLWKRLQLSTLDMMKHHTQLHMVEVDKSLPDEEKCEVAFMKTNTIDCAWWENEEVTAMFPEKTCRSTSSGDMVLIGNTKYKCVAVGWEKM